VRFNRGVLTAMGVPSYVATVLGQTSGLLLTGEKSPARVKTISLGKGRIFYAEFASEPFPYRTLRMRQALTAEAKDFSVAAERCRFVVKGAQLYDADATLVVAVGKI